MNDLAPRAAFRINGLSELKEFAAIAAKSGFVPRDYANKPEAIMIAVAMGAELGLAPLQSLQNIAVIGNRPSVFGDALLALVRAHPACTDVREWVQGEGDQRAAYCEIHRRGQSDTLRKFSVADAKKAGLWGRSGPWTQYSERMLQMRARGFAARDAFPDALKGLISYEEARDIEMHEADRRARVSHDFSNPLPEAEVNAAAEALAQRAVPSRELFDSAHAKPIDEEQAPLDAPAAPFTIHGPKGKIAVETPAEWVASWQDVLEEERPLPADRRAKRTKWLIERNLDMIDEVARHWPEEAEVVRRGLEALCAPDAADGLDPDEASGVSGSLGPTDTAEEIAG